MKQFGGKKCHERHDVDRMNGFTTGMVHTIWTKFHSIFMQTILVMKLECKKVNPFYTFPRTPHNNSIQCLLCLKYRVKQLLPQPITLQCTREKYKCNVNN